MYHTRKATDPRDKVYALLGMSSDDRTVAGLSANYNIPWGELFEKLIHFVLSERVSVDTWDDKEIAVIKGKGCILGEVSSVERDIAWEDRQHVGITWQNAPSHFGVRRAWSSRWTFQVSAKSVQVGDAICLLRGASRPTIIRQYGDYWAVIMIAVTPTDDLRGYSDSEKGNTKELEAMVDQLSKDKGQWTLLCLAAGNGHEAVAKLLLDTGKVDPDVKELQTALWLAGVNVHDAVVKLLLDTGKVDPGVKSADGRTAVHLAAKNGHEAVVKLLQSII
ncbi:hypothetical protein DL765_010045 [Monosporascus sp. GIB2]|nr:hypothetical protein DL765_010045 [Monosporascus sp. GIB2]